MIASQQNAKLIAVARGAKQKARRARREREAQWDAQCSKSLPLGGHISVLRVSYNSVLSTLPGQGYRGQRGKLADEALAGTWSKQRAEDAGFQYIEWDGV